MGYIKEAFSNKDNVSMNRLVVFVLTISLITYVFLNTFGVISCDNYDKTLDIFSYIICIVLTLKGVEKGVEKITKKP